MFVASFYSYKGGVGRSVALMNTAHQLALNGRRVLMLDFDLEAPGLDSASRSAAAWGRQRNRAAGLGFVDYFADYAEHRVVPLVERYVSAGFGPNNLIHLLPAGDIDKFAVYSRKLFVFNERLFDRTLYVRELLLKMRSDLEEMGFDYLLVDSRTGHTDILGATTVLLPHLVVFLTNPSQQSLRGTRSVIEWVASASDAALRKVPAEQASENSFFLRSVEDPGIETLIVASPIPFGDRSAGASIRKVLGRSPDHTIYYAPRIAADEGEHIADVEEADPAKQYRRLAEKIQTLNPFEPETLVDFGFDSLSRQDWRLALSYFDAAEYFSETTKSSGLDRALAARRTYGEARALALGFQLDKALARLEAVDSKVALGVSDLRFEPAIANLQMVKGYLASNKFEEAKKPAMNAVELALALRERGRPHALELVAKLQLAEVLRLCGEMQQAEEVIAGVPADAKLLNRRIEEVKAYQLLAMTQVFLGKFETAAASLGQAVEVADTLGVTYLRAESSFVQSLIDLTRGQLKPRTAARLSAAAKIYREEGDGLGEANCLNELAIYNHRIDKNSSTVGPSLRRSFALYDAIAGTSPGKCNVLLSVAEVQTDRGQLGARTVDGLEGASEALARAFRIATHNRLHSTRDDVRSWLRLVWLFTKQDAPRYLEHLRLPTEALSYDDDLVVLPVSIATISRARNEAFQVLLQNSTPQCVERITFVAEEAERLGLQYDEAVTRTLVGLACIRYRDKVGLESQFDRLRDVVSQGRFSWTIWGQVNNVRTRLYKGGDTHGWHTAAAELLEEAERRELLTTPDFWKEA